MLRNREIRQLATGYAVATLIAVVLAGSIHPAAGLLLLAFATASGAAFFQFTRTRYQRIAELSEQIDHVLHQPDQVWISSCEEGELSILRSEIQKMVLRIQTQNHTLQREKNHLADSLADIAHQLRTPLTSANLALSLLRHAPAERKRRELVREIQGLFAQMDWLLTSLLKLSRLDAGVVAFQQQTVAVADVIHTALRPLQIALELHQVTVSLDIPATSVLQGDANWLAEAFQNLMKNSLESVSNSGPAASSIASPNSSEGGQVSGPIDSQNGGEDGQIALACVDTLLYTEITIHDSGPGFDPSDIPYLFDRFYRGNRPSSVGYGIGLALAQTIFKRQGGTITAKNHPQGGALFTVRFPK